MDTYNKADGSSFSNTNQVVITHYNVKVSPHLKTNSVDVEVLYSLEVSQPTSVIVLDTMSLNIQSAKFGDTDCKFTIGNNEAIGAPMILQLPQVLQLGKHQGLKILSNAVKPAGLTWGDYVFTQNQPIYCRSIFPCHDTPSSKSTFDIEVVLDQQDKHLKVFASGIRVSKGVDKFKMDIPIPSYLFAFLIGNFEQRMISQRLGVVAEPSILNNVCQEVEESEKFLKTLEKLLFPYQFGQYNLCILPKSFPYGGMENPIFTFLSPSVVTGDRTGLPVVIHQMAHSWTGNLVSCKNWENFWMNEGFTVFFENKAIKQLYGQDLYQLCCLMDQNALLKVIDGFGESHPFTSLNPILDHCNPDDAFSTVPYYKGLIFLTYLETLVGQQHFLICLRTFIQKYSRKSVDYLMWKKHLEEYVSTNNINLKQEIDWGRWVHQPGYPPRLDLFKSDQYDNIKAVVSNQKVNPEGFYLILQGTMYDFSPLNIKKLQLLLSELEKEELKLQQVKSLDSKFKLTETLMNYELLTEWFKICLKAGHLEILPQLNEKVLKKMGRMKFIRPLYKYLHKLDSKLAAEYFSQNKCNYSIIANEQIKKDLGLND